jgi:transposase-like protein
MENGYTYDCIDVDTKECLAIWVSDSRTSFHAYVFLRDVLKYCENKPEFVVDNGISGLSKG